MHRKIRLKKKIRIHIKGFTNKIFLIIVLLLIGLILTFKYINTRVSPVISDYAKIEAKTLSTYIINKSIARNISGIINTDELFLITKNKTITIKNNIENIVNKIINNEFITFSLNYT